MGPKRLHSTMLAGEEEAAVVEYLSELLQTRAGLVMKPVIGGGGAASRS